MWGEKVTLIIGDKTKFESLIKDELVEINNLCRFKSKINEHQMYDIIIDQKYLVEGIFDKTTIFLDELLLMIPVKRFVYLPRQNRLLLTEIASMYNVLVEFSIF